MVENLYFVVIQQRRGLWSALFNLLQPEMAAWFQSELVSDIAIFVLKGDVKLQLANFSPDSGVALVLALVLQNVEFSPPQTPRKCYS